MSEKFQFRVAGAGDIAALVEMINAAFAVETFLEGPRTDAARLAAAMEAGEILMAVDESENPVATANIERRGKRAYMGLFGVDPKRQGQGLSRMILEEAELRLRAEGVTAIDLTVLNLRQELLPIYRKLGFRETGTLPFHMDQKVKPGFECHLIAMTKEI
ncbi:MAG: GNAT family N-acetyltransferase [Acidobacteriota bacterium]|nr:GNAT family N-acetyltransferase [Acidobacteriota bacterium]